MIEDSCFVTVSIPSSEGEKTEHGVKAHIFLLILILFSSCFSVLQLLRSHRSIATTLVDPDGARSYPEWALSRQLTLTSQSLNASYTTARLPCVVVPTSLTPA